MTNKSSRTTQLIDAMYKTDSVLIMENNSLIPLRLFSKKHNRIIGYFEPKKEADIQSVIDAVKQYTTTDSDLIIITGRRPIDVDDDVFFTIMNGELANIDMTTFSRIDADAHLLFVINIDKVIAASEQRARFLIGIGADNVCDVTVNYAYHSGTQQINLTPQQRHPNQPVLSFTSRG